VRVQRYCTPRCSSGLGEAVPRFSTLTAARCLYPATHLPFQLRWMARNAASSLQLAMPSPNVHFQRAHILQAHWKIAVPTFRESGISSANHMLHTHLRAPSGRSPLSSAAITKSSLLTHDFAAYLEQFRLILASVRALKLRHIGFCLAATQVRDRPLPEEQKPAASESEAPSQVSCAPWSSALPQPGLLLAAAPDLGG
jgi:hypothetical protein